MQRIELISLLKTQAQALANLKIPALVYSRSPLKTQVQVAILMMEPLIQAQDLRLLQTQFD